MSAYYTVTRGPVQPAAPITFIVLDDEGRVAIGPLDFPQVSGLIVDLLEAMTVAVMPPGAVVLERCIDLGIDKAQGPRRGSTPAWIPNGNGQQEAKL